MSNSNAINKERPFVAVLYARVSTDDKGQTNETQIRELKEYVQRNNFVIADDGDAVYTDEQTAKNDKRDGFRLLKGRISEGDIEYVLARNQDRISREPLDYQKFLDYCNKFGVRVRFSDNSSQPETESGVVLDSVLSGLAKADNMKRSSNTKKGMATAKLNGVHCGRMLMFCFTDEIEQNRARIQTEGEHKTVLLSVDSVMDFARQGISMYNASEKILGISYMTLSRAMKRRGLFEQYEEIRQNRLTQGKTNTRVAKPTESLTKGGDE